MPQEPIQVTITTNDTSYIIYSGNEGVKAVPDSIKELMGGKHFYDSIINTVIKEPTLSKTEEVSWPLVLFGAIFLIGIIIFKISEAFKELDDEMVGRPGGQTIEEVTPVPMGFIYRGKTLQFSKEELHKVCLKYNPFYKQLSEPKQTVFINRLSIFIASKDFYIMSEHGLKEMPILVSAAAIQISFGLDEYTLPYFSRIIIHPEEYIAYDPLRILIGNVQGDTIAVSWKHFLEDYQNPTDGKNVGLHEMAHALQVQYVFQNYGYGNDFRLHYNHYDKIDEEVLLAERTNNTALFDDNALSNPNEFWATCVELFFEKPVNLHQLYPHLYKSICNVLNQDTLQLNESSLQV